MDNFQRKQKEKSSLPPIYLFSLILLLLANIIDLYTESSYFDGYLS